MVRSLSKRELFTFGNTYIPEHGFSTSIKQLLILRFSCSSGAVEDCRWDTLDATLTTARQSPVAIPVPVSWVQKHCSNLKNSYKVADADLSGVLANYA